MSVGYLLLSVGKTWHRQRRHQIFTRSFVNLKPRTRGFGFCWRNAVMVMEMEMGMAFIHQCLERTMEIRLISGALMR